ncbi:MAG TPA: DEAD/DEAH box helicase [Candidatus Saccharimonadales bacterium]|jgi:superfamily II DNA/RNA helicase|nr:DEAD/DEAH box helicase [Candidatus Saccharimonadales bacterium]
MPYYQNKRPDRHGRGQARRKDYIHPSRFIQSAKPQTATQYSPAHTFAEFALNPLIKSNLTRMGFTDPSPIQDQAIPAGLQGRDVVGLANTGTGKTAAFAVPLLNRLLTDRTSRAIILAPTRELAQQIDEQCRQIAKGSDLNGAILIGGVPMGPQLRQLRYNPRIIIGTPGRIKDHLERRSLDLADCNLVVLDEVDRMLDMGFVNDIRHILGRTNSVRQSFYFSATLDNKVKAIIDGFSHDPLLISVKQGESSDHVEQNIINFSSSSDKIGKLHDLLIQEATVKALVFDDTHRSVEKLSKELEARGFSSDSIHGGKSQSQRQRVLKRFKDSQINVLVATDVAARGLDVSDISHVINYSSPQSYEDYVHRIGRTGRAGKIGHALTFVEQ